MISKFFPTSESHSPEFYEDREILERERKRRELILAPVCSNSVMDKFGIKINRFYRTVMFGGPTNTFDDAVIDGTTWGRGVGENLGRRSEDNFDQFAKYGRKMYKTVTTVVENLITDENESVDAKRKTKAKTRKVVGKTQTDKPRSMVGR